MKANILRLGLIFFVLTSFGLISLFAKALPSYIIAILTILVVLSVIALIVLRVNTYSHFSIFFYKKLPWLITFYFSFCLLLGTFETIILKNQISEFLKKNLYVSIVLVTILYLYTYIQKRH